MFCYDVLKLFKCIIVINENYFWTVIFVDIYLKRNNFFYIGKPTFTKINLFRYPLCNEIMLVSLFLVVNITHIYYTCLEIIVE